MKNTVFLVFFQHSHVPYSVWDGDAGLAISSSGLGECLASRSHSCWVDASARPETFHQSTSYREVSHMGEEIHNLIGR